MVLYIVFFFFSSRRRHTRCGRDWSSDVCSSDLAAAAAGRNPDAVRIICRGVVLAGSEAKGPDGRRRLLSGSYEQILQDAAWLAGEGVTELFYDLNWDPQVGNPAVAPAEAAERAGEILAGLAPR